MTTVTHPQDALAYVWKEFPLATMETLRDSGGRLYGYMFRVGRSKHFARLELRGGVDYCALALWCNTLAYARDKRREKAKTKRHVERTLR
jgi:hypothetical protein